MYKLFVQDKFIYQQIIFDRKIDPAPPPRPLYSAPPTLLSPAPLYLAPPHTAPPTQPSPAPLYSAPPSGCDGAAPPDPTCDQSSVLNSS